MQKMKAVPLLVALLVLALIPSASGGQAPKGARVVKTHVGGVDPQVVVYQRQGQHERCNGDVCSGIALRPIRFAFNNQTQGYDALVTVSMTYSASRDDRFVVRLMVERHGSRGLLALRPDQRPIVSGGWQAGTYQWLVPNLSSNDDYDLWVDPKVTRIEGPNQYDVQFRHLAVTIEAVPRTP